MRFILQRTILGYLLSAVGIFSFSAVAKLTASYTTKELNQYDPFLSFLTVKQLLGIVTGVEACVVLLILLNIKRSPRTGLLVAIWLALLFLAYRLAFAFAPDRLNVVTVCKCFGGSGGILGKHSDTVAWIFLFYLLCAGAVLLFASAIGNTKSAKSGVRLNLYDLSSQ